MTLTAHRQSIVLVLATAVLAGCATASGRVPACDANGAVQWAAAARVSAPGQKRHVAVWLDVDSRSSGNWASLGGTRVRRAIGYWNSLSLPVTFVMAQSPKDAELTIDVIPSFPPDPGLKGDEFRAGLTTLTFDEFGNISRARLFIAESTPYGTRYSAQDQEATLLHELGHALGLPHATNPMALMASRPRVSMITITDVGLAHSIYRGRGCPRARLAADRPYDR